VGIVALLSLCVAVLGPYSGRFGLVKNFVVCFLGLFLLMATVGSALHDFMFAK
jgi:hypothetical protein